MADLVEQLRHYFRLLGVVQAHDVLDVRFPRLRRAFVLAALLATACRTRTPPGATTPSSRGTPEAAKEVQAAAPVRVHVEELPGEDRWRVRYDLAAPAHALVFERMRSRFRAASWTVPEGFVWHELASRDAIVAANGSSFTTVEVSFASDFTEKTKDYALTLPFSDGSRLLYTGHLAVRPCGTGGAGCPQPWQEGEAAVGHAWTFETSSKRSIMLLEQRRTASLEWKPRVGYGETYVYFGDIAPQDGERMTLLIDPGMPAWMTAHTRELVPQLFEHYARLTGVELSFRPLVLLSFGGTNTPGLTTGGGTLDGLVQLSASGIAATVEDDATSEQWLRFLAHEVFHLWNAHMFSTTLGSSEEWLSEGSGDWFALLALRDLGVLEPHTYATRLLETANRCVLSLGNRPVLASHLEGDYSGFYACGLSALHMLDRAIAKASPGQDLTDAFRIMFAARLEDRTYSTYMLLEAIESLTHDPLSVAAVERLLRTGASEGTETLVHGELVRTGLSVELTSPERATVPAIEHWRALTRLLSDCDCDGRLVVTWRADGFEMAPSPQCRAFAKGGVVTHVGPHALATAPAAAHSLLHRSATRGDTIPLRMVDRGTVRLRCRHGYAPPYRALLRQGTPRAEASSTRLPK